MAQEKIGIYGGCFNPPHMGHLMCAAEALLGLGLDRVLLVPVGEPAHRKMEEDPGREARFALCEQAVAEHPRISVSRVELDRPGHSYMVETLALLNQQYPQAELTLIIGGDEAAAFASWREPEEILERAQVGIAERDGRSQQQIRELNFHLRGGHRMEFFNMPRMDLSSSEIRARIQMGLPIHYFVHPAVERVISEQSLYRSDQQ